MGISNSPIFKISHRQFIIDKKVCLPTDLYVEKMRYRAVSCMSRSYRPTIPVSYIARVLGFCRTSDGNDEDSDGSGLVGCLEWMKAHGACLASDDGGEIQLDTKVSPI